MSINVTIWRIVEYFMIILWLGVVVSAVQQSTGCLRELGQVNILISIKYVFTYTDVLSIHDCVIAYYRQIIIEFRLFPSMIK